MPFTFYKLIHLVGVFMVFLSFGGLIIRELTGVRTKELKSLCGLTNGIGMLLTLVGGFGLTVKLGIGMPGWVIGKMVIWVFFAIVISVINRNPNLGKILWWVILFLGAGAGFLVIFKPF